METTIIIKHLWTWSFWSFLAKIGSIIQKCTPYWFEPLRLYSLGIWYVGSTFESSGMKVWFPLRTLPCNFSHFTCWRPHFLIHHYLPNRCLYSVSLTRILQIHSYVPNFADKPVGSECKILMMKFFNSLVLVRSLHEVWGYRYMDTRNLKE